VKACAGDCSAAAQHSAAAASTARRDAQAGLPDSSTAAASASAEHASPTTQLRKPGRAEGGHGANRRACTRRRLVTHNDGEDDSACVHDIERTGLGCCQILVRWSSDRHTTTRSLLVESLSPLLTLCVSCAVSSTGGASVAARSGGHAARFGTLLWCGGGLRTAVFPASSLLPARGASAPGVLRGGVAEPSRRAGAALERRLGGREPRG